MSQSPSNLCFFVGKPKTKTTREDMPEFLKNCKAINSRIEIWPELKSPATEVKPKEDNK